MRAQFCHGMDTPHQWHARRHDHAEGAADLQRTVRSATGIDDRRSKCLVGVDGRGPALRERVSLAPESRPSGKSNRSSLACHQRKFQDPSPSHRCSSAARPSDRCGLIAQLQSHSAAILGTSECSAVTSSRFLHSLLILSRKLWNRT